MLTKMVNGVVVQMTAEEEAAIRADWAAPSPKQTITKSQFTDFRIKNFPVYAPTNIPTSFKPSAIAYAGDGSMYVAGQSGAASKLIRMYLVNTVVLFETALPDGANPLGIAVCGGTIWTANYSGNSLSVVNANTGAVIDTIDTSAHGLNPESIVCTGRHVWVSFNSSYTIAQYDVATRAWVRTETVGRFPGWLAYSKGHLFVTTGGEVSGCLHKIKVSEGAFEVIWSAPTGTYPLASVVSPDGYVWVGAYWDCNVTRINEQTGEVAGTYALSGTPRGGTCDGQSVSFVVFPYNGVGSSHSLTMFALDGTKIDEYPVGQYPRAVAFDGLNHYVANSDSLYITKF